MRAKRRVMSALFPWVLACCLAVALYLVCPAAAAEKQAKTATHALLQLDGPWRFAAGDDPGWAKPEWDDKDWTAVDLGKPLSEQGVLPYTGYGWYRLKVDPQPMADAGLDAATPLALLMTSNSVGAIAVFVNGQQVGQSTGMRADPSMYLETALPVWLPREPAGPLVIAIRTWVDGSLSVNRGVLQKVAIGRATDIGELNWIAWGMQWNEHATAVVIVAFLFFCVALLGAALFLAQRSHSEYLWLALLCFCMTVSGVNEALFGLTVLPFAGFVLFARFIGHVFMVVTLEFILRFTGVKKARAVRVVQAALVLVPVMSFALPMRAYDVLSVAAEIVFCAVVCVLLFRAWRGGQSDAGIMLLPFFLAAIADSADTVLGLAASESWIPMRFAQIRYHVGPVAVSTSAAANTLFLGSLLAVILYRFIRVSQDEQRSAAEIAAARSVQSILIPTELPKSRNFMLESAYLPVHGVGGDFFQVLPLKDDSLLIVVGDVSGKGLQAAMSSSTLVGALRNELSHEPATVLEHLNRVLLGAGYGDTAHALNSAGPSFATCLCARAHPDGTLVIANAGHLGPYRDGRELEIPADLPLGVIPNVEYEQVTYRMEQGDRLVFLSDGVVEAMNAEGELFGFERTQQVSNEPARYIAQTAKRFGQTDDITVVSVYFVARKGAKAPAAELEPA